MTYKTKPIKPRKIDFDLIVIGSGAGGSVAARMIASIGKKVAVFEQDKAGGSCPNYGCVPTKALLHAAKTYKTVENASRFGINTSQITADYEAIKNWKNKAIRDSGAHEIKKALLKDGIALHRGHAHFLDPWTISVNGKRYTAHRFLVASGSHDLIPPIPGLRENGSIDYRQAQKLEKLPKKLAIIGGGAIGSEFAHYFSTFGVEVHLMESDEKLIFREDEEMGEYLEDIIEKNGVHVHLDSDVLMVDKKGQQKIVSFKKHGKIHKIVVDEILVTTGKLPNTDLGLENAGIKYSHSGGIGVNAEMATSTPHIYAAGDVTGKYLYAHIAAYESRVAGLNMFSELKHLADYRAVPRVIHVAPEFAATGMTENELQKKKTKYQVANTPVKLAIRASTSNENTGFVKIIANKKGVILGASIVAPRAGEMIQELTLAIQWRMKASKLDYTMHAYPTWSQAVQICASKIKCR